MEIELDSDGPEAKPQAELKLHPWLHFECNFQIDIDPRSCPKQGKGKNGSAKMSELAKFTSLRS